MAARILIVEDNPDLLAILEQVLVADFDVRTALCGEDAVAIAQSFHPDVVLMDMQLPGIDGVETGRRIKAEAAPRFVPILVLTALGNMAETEIVASRCCDAFMSKPAPLVNIRAKVNDLLYSHTGIN
jgi:two-component system cell cycle response regulator